ncbi:MAG TPA: CpsD/CapB family tyrosine-protein kinase [Terriglobales bacterium]
MSRIFDALRQSEKDKLVGSDRWALPDAPKVDATSSSEALGADQAEPQGIESTQVPIAAPAGEGVPHDTVQQIRQAVTHEDVTSRIAELARSLQAARSSLTPVPAQPPVAYLNISIAAPVETKFDLTNLKVIDPQSISSPMVVALNSERELGAEKFRVLGARLSNMRMGTKLKVLHVTSSILGEGKTLTAVNLAITLATRFAQKVLLIEGDLRKPAVCELLGQHGLLGIGEWFQEQDSPITDFIVRVGESSLCILPAGNVAHPASVLQSPRTSEMVHEVAQWFDWVVVDTPPLLPMADSNIWSRVADGTLLVVRKGVVTRAALKRAYESIDNPKLVGVVLNDANDFDRVNYYSQYSTVGSEGTARKAVTR